MSEALFEAVGEVRARSETSHTFSGWLAFFGIRGLGLLGAC